MATTQPEDSQQETQQRIATIAAWCQDVNSDDYDEPLVDRAEALSTLDDRLRRAFVADRGREPTHTEHFHRYRNALERFGYRWDEGTFSVQPAASDPVQTTVPYAYFLTSNELAATRAMLSALQRRAEAKGFNGSVDLVAVPATRRHAPAASAQAATVHGWEVTIEGRPPCYEGWRILVAADLVQQPGRTFDLDRPPYFYAVNTLARQRGGSWVSAAFVDEIKPQASLRYEVVEVGPSGRSNTIDVVPNRVQAEDLVTELSRAYAATGTPVFTAEPTIALRCPPGAVGVIDRADIRPGECDHCHTNRSGSTTFVVEREDTGERMQVSSSCMKDFLGYSTLPAFLDVDQVAEVVSNARAAGTEAWDVDQVLTYAWAVIETYGWRPANDTLATRDLVADAMLGTGSGVEVLGSIAPKLPEGRTVGARIITDLTAKLDPAQPYEAKLLDILSGGVVDRRKHLGLVVSAINAWRRLDQAQAETTPAESRTISYAGTVGDKLTLTGTVIVVAAIDGYHDYSPPRRLLVIDCGEHVAKTITSAAWAYTVERGDTLTVQGTVKAHQDYQGVAQTVLTRPKRVDQPAAAEPAQLVWEAVRPIPPQSRFQEAPLAAPAPSATTALAI